MDDKFFDRILARADLYTETLPGTTLVELVGNSRVLIENHRGVTVYGCSEICINGSNGPLCIRGQKLELARMTRQQLVIVGRIDCISIA